MFRTWLIVGTIIVSIISALFVLRATLKQGIEIGENRQKVIILEEKNKDLSNALENQNQNIKEAQTFDDETQVRTIDNEFIVPRILFPTANGRSELELELDKEFTENLKKLR